MHALVMNHGPRGLEVLGTFCYGVHLRGCPPRPSYHSKPPEKLRGKGSGVLLSSCVVMTVPMDRLNFVNSTGPPNPGTG